MKMPHLVTATEHPLSPHPPIVSGFAGLWVEVLVALRNLLRNPPQEKQLRLLESLPLGGRRQLMLVSCGKERFLVGSGPDTIQTIVKLTQEAKGSDVQSLVPIRVQSIGDQT